MSASSFSGELANLEKSIAALEARSVRCVESLTASFRDADACLKACNEAQKELKHVQSLAGTADEKARTKAPFADLKRIASRHAPKTGSLYVRLMLGRVNVKQPREDDRLTRKNEYEKFRSRTNLIFLALVLARAACFFALPQTSAASSGSDILVADLVETSSLTWLLYYYTTLALRENILRVNGSAIADWWITHHYLSGLLTVVCLAWPKAVDPVYEAFRPVMLTMSVIQAITQILVTRYQSGRLYRLVAMGKASRLDVTGESNTEWVGAGWTPSAAVLLPFLLVAQCFQLFSAYTLFSTIAPRYAANLPVTWHSVAVGLLFLALGCGNLFSTLRVYARKVIDSVAGKKPAAAGAAKKDD
jgi:hypothetical protein